MELIQALCFASKPNSYYLREMCTAAPWIIASVIPGPRSELSPLGSEYLKNAWVREGM